MGDCDVLDKSLDPYMIYGQYKVGLGPLPETIAVPKSPTIWIWAIILSAVNPMEQLQTEWALTNRSIGEDPVQVFPISISASQQYCYHQSKTEICTSPRRTYQVKMNEILLSLMLACLLWHHWRANRFMPFCTAFHWGITRAITKGFNLWGQIIVTWKPASSQCLLWSKTPYNIQGSGPQLKQWLGTPCWTRRMLKIHHTLHWAVCLL